MKKREKSISKELPLYVLYLDDLENVVSIFKEIAESVTIETDEFILSNLDEIQNIHEEKLNHLDIETSQPNMELYFSKFFTKFYARDDTIETRGVEAKIMEILDKRKRFSNWHGLGIGALLLNSGIIISLISLSIGFALFTPGIIFVLYFCFRFFYKNTSIIYLKRRKEYPPIWVRKKDDIILSLVSAVIGALVYWILSSILS